MTVLAEIVIRNLRKEFGDFTAVQSSSFKIEDGEFFMLLGPSGCGKTTTLNIIAGLETPNDGRVVFDRDEVTQLPPERRDVAMVFQTYALYPHMRVYDNIAFGLRMRRTPKGDIDQRVRLAAQSMEIDHLLARKPRELSGGQRQRVALARAIVRDPCVFLLDEPLSNLDAQLRVTMRTELKRLHAELQKTFVYVTHDQAESLIMSDRIGVMYDGRLQQLGSPEAVYNEPVNVFVAKFVGSPPMNFFDGTLQCQENTRWQVQGEGFTCDLPDHTASGQDSNTNREVRLGIRPEDIEVIPDEAPTAHAVVVVREPLGSDLYLTMEMYGTTFKARTRPDVSADRGTHVPVRFVPDKVHIFDRQTEKRLRPRDYDK